LTSSTYTEQQHNVGCIYRKR